MASDLVFRLVGQDTSATDALQDLEGAAGNVAKGIAAAFAGMALADAFNQNLDDEKMFGKFKAGLGQTPEVARQAADTAGQLYRDGWGESLEGVTDAIGSVGAQMVDLGATSPAELEKITTQAMSVADVMGVDVVDVTRAAGQMMKNGLAPDAQSALDIIATGAQNGANNAGDLLDVFSEYGDSFKNVGLSGEDALGMIKGAMDAGAFSADIAADSVREFATRTLDGSAEASGAFQTLGIDAGSFTAAVAEGGPAAEAAFQQAVKGLASMTDPLAREQAGIALFGSMWEDAGADMVLSMGSGVGAITDVNGAASTMADTLHDNTATGVDAVKRTMEGWLQTATNLPGPLGATVATLATVGPTAVSMGASVLMGVQAFKSLGIATKAVAIAQGILNAVMALNPIVLIVAAVAALVAGFIYLWNTSDGFREFWIGLWDKIKEIAGVVADWFVARWNEVWAFFEGVVQWIKDAWSTLTAAFQLVITAIKDFFVNTWNEVWAFFEGVVGWIKGAWDTLMAALRIALDWVKGIFEGIWNGIKGFFQTIVDGLQWIWEKYTDFLKAYFDIVGGAFRQLWEWIKSFFDFIVGGLRAIWDGFVGVLTAAFDFIGGAFRQLWEWIKSVFEFVVGGLRLIWDGLTAAWKAGLDWFGGIFQSIWGGISGFFTGIADGVRGTWDTMVNKLRDAIQWCKDTIMSIFGGIGGWFANLWSSIYSFAKGIWDRIWKAIEDTIAKIKEAIEWAKQLATSQITDPDSGFRQAASWIPGAGPLLGFLPKTATGGIVNGAQARIVGEAGPEAIIPLSKSSLASYGLGGGGDGGQAIHIHMPNGLIVGTADEVARKLATVVADAQRRGVVSRAAFTGGRT